MLAAHRHGGRTTLLAFARSWDRFAGATRVRRATRRELAVLERELVASLAGGEPVDFGGAIAEHQALRARRAPERTFPELKARRLRPRGDAERALAGLSQHELAARTRSPV